MHPHSHHAQPITHNMFILFTFKASKYIGFMSVRPRRNGTISNNGCHVKEDWTPSPCNCFSESLLLPWWQPVGPWPLPYASFTKCENLSGSGALGTSWPSPLTAAEVLPTSIPNVSLDWQHSCSEGIKTNKYKRRVQTPFPPTHTSLKKTQPIMYLKLLIYNK